MMSKIWSSKCSILQSKCKILRFNGCDYEEFRLLGFDAVWLS
jgi:hypothetical protein